MQSMFMRRGVGDVLPPVGGLGLDMSGPNASKLTETELAGVRAAQKSQGECCSACAEGKCLDPCVNGFRVLTRDAKGNPTAAEPCTSSSGGGSSGLTPDQQKQIGAALASGGAAAAQALINVLFPKGKDSAPPPKDPNIIAGVPNIVLIGIGVVVVAAVAYMLLRK